MSARPRRMAQGFGVDVGLHYGRAGGGERLAGGQAHAGAGARVEQVGPSNRNCDVGVEEFFTSADTAVLDLSACWSVIDVGVCC
jgi:hypothetical protein